MKSEGSGESCVFAGRMEGGEEENSDELRKEQRQTSGAKIGVDFLERLGIKCCYVYCELLKTLQDAHTEMLALATHLHQSHE